MIASNAVPGFTPSANGFRFANRFEPGPTVRFGPLDPRLIGVGDAAGGLCGGMAWFVRERFEAGGPRESSGFSDTGRVRDRDMQRIINGLWESGAEAVAINGQRLTSLSAIRAAGDAILVDNKPLVPPYTILAIGDGQRLSTAFQDSADGQYLHALVENFGIRSGITAEGDVRLPAAPSLTVRTAEPRGAGATPSGRATADTGKGTS